MATAEPTTAPGSGADLPCGDILVPIGKEHSLAADCSPPDLQPLPESMSYFVDLPIVMRAEAARAMEEMLRAALADGYVIVVRSAYRSFDAQASTFQYWVNTIGLEAAERSSARPGHSEHQLGTTADVTSASNGFGLEGFETTPEGRWIAANTSRFGFTISYPQGSENVTGYIYEPWHVRYLGREVAKQIATSGLVPIEFLERR